MSGSAAAGTRGAFATWRRIRAMILRYVYLYRGSWPRILEMAYWPTLQMIMWGFLTIFLASKSGFFVQAAGVLIAAVLLWDVLFRASLGVSLSFLEEMWSRNLGHLFVSPLRPGEFVAALTLMSAIRVLIGVIPAALLAIWLYAYSIFDMGLPLIAFFANLQVMGWSFGLVVCGLLMRYGLGAESIAWFAIFAVAPFSAIYYPLSVMPDWLQWIAGILPSTHVFEGMRAVLVDGTFRTDLLVNAVALNAVYLTVSVLVFLRFFRSARERGLILQIGE
ncbi:MAG: ABC transporter permease [Rhodospirillaceae bacterium]|nr:ABC transporter permease [Rhodospirillaceae bacterium]MYF85944.1 ABC transporter permease [Rhodospirillaceae bacterium]MYH39027.1 ABC transporter permease [Rhodospirillaceae bacterium]MYK13410.1 ABC transporter permease [Rhodospirillaceae bacterium]